MKRALVQVLMCCLPAVPLSGQLAVPPAHATPFKDTSILRPPTGVKLAIIEFEDLECFACAQAAPIVQAAMAHYNVPRVHHDFIIQGHTWSRPAAIYARYLEDRVSLSTAEAFRRDVSADQALIASQDDLQRFTQGWFQSHGQRLPFVIDPSGRCADEVQADCALGIRLGLLHTPTIFVVTQKKWIEVTDPRELPSAIELAQASLRVTPSPPFGSSQLKPRVQAKRCRKRDSRGSAYGFAAVLGTQEARPTNPRARRRP